MRAGRLLLSTMAAVLSVAASSSQASAHAAEESGGFGFCWGWTEEAGNSVHKFALPGGYYNNPHYIEQAGFCNVHDLYPAYFC